MELEQLPDSLLLEVFRYLPPDELCLAARPVSPRWRAISQDAELWKHVDIPHHFTDDRFMLLLNQVGVIAVTVLIRFDFNLHVCSFESGGSFSIPGERFLNRVVACGLCL